MKILKGNTMKALALTLVLVLAFSMTTFASQDEKEENSVDNTATVKGGEVTKDDTEESETSVPETGDIIQNEETVLTNEIIEELKAAGIEVSPYALTANVSTYDDILTVLEFPVFEGVVILNDIQFDDVINLDRDFTFSAASGLESVTLFSAERLRHFNITSDVALTFDHVAIDGNEIGGGITSTNNTLSISNLTFQNCRNGIAGGGLFLTDGNLTLSDCYFTNCTGSAARGGGGIYINNSIAHVSNSIFDNNTSQNGAGIMTEKSTCIVESCTFSNNNGSSGVGINSGGLTGSLEVTDCEFYNNTGHNGGAIYVYGNAVIRDSKIHDNVASSSGGGISLFRDSTLIMYDCDIFNNTSTRNDAMYGQGGGIYTVSNCTIELYNVTIQNNEASRNGGGIFLVLSHLETTNTIISNNKVGRSEAGSEIDGRDSTYYVNTGQVGNNEIVMR